MVDRNTLFYGDNLDILRHHIPAESVDLVYLDPPFNSKRDYNVLFKERSGEASPAQIEAFTDTWSWDRAAEKTYSDLVQTAPANVAEMLGALLRFIGRNDMMAYLVMMAARLVELHRVLKPTGSLYLHCDPTASHYLKIVLDTVFEPRHFRNEVIWRRTGAHNKVRRYGPIHDVILFYTKSDRYVWNNPRRPYMRGHVSEHFVMDEKGWHTNYYGNVLTGSGTRGGESGQPWRGFDPTAKGRHWAIPGAVVSDLEESGIDISGLGQHEKLEIMFENGYITIQEGQAWPVYGRYLKRTDGQALSDIWAFQPYTEGTVFGTEAGIDADVRWLQTKDQERLGYPTQKPLALLERIIVASSNPGDLVLDPFCGCGTAVVAAEKLGRRWVGIDVTHLAITLMKERLRDSFPGIDFDVRGEPADLGSARLLAETDRYQFQWWALSLVRAKPAEGREKKGADKGIDGVIVFSDDHTGKLKRCLVQVKSGKVKSGDVRDLRGTLEREGAELGLFVTLDTPSSDMNREAAIAGMYRSEGWQRDYPRIQIATIGDLLAGVHPAIPYGVLTFAKAPRVGVDTGERQATMELPGSSPPTVAPRSS